MLESLDSRELTYWRAYYAHDPFGGERGDIQAAIVAQVVANANRGKRAAYRLTEFMPKWGRRPEQSIQELMAAGRHIAAVCSGKHSNAKR